MTKRKKKDFKKDHRMAKMTKNDKNSKNDKNVAKFTFWSHHGFCFQINWNFWRFQRLEPDAWFVQKSQISWNRRGQRRSY